MPALDFSFLLARPPYVLLLTNGVSEPRLECGCVACGKSKAACEAAGTWTEHSLACPAFLGLSGPSSLISRYVPFPP